jgi:hypothetical protein
MHDDIMHGPEHLEKKGLFTHNSLATIVEYVIVAEESGL